MPGLILFRHAKSDQQTEEADHERPLNPRGERSADAMGRFLRGVDQVPDAVLVSSALRATETVRRAQEAGEWQCPVTATDALYNCSPGETLAQIQAVDDDVELLMVAGHEPTTSELAIQLIGGGQLGVPTATAIRIDFAAPWPDTAPGAGVLAWLVPARLLTDSSFL